MYKQQQHNVVFGSHEKRYFTGVQGKKGFNFLNCLNCLLYLVKGQEGDLFGVRNLLAVNDVGSSITEAVVSRTEEVILTNLSGTTCPEALLIYSRLQMYHNIHIAKLSEDCSQPTGVHEIDATTAQLFKQPEESNSDNTIYQLLRSTGASFQKHSNIVGNSLIEKQVAAEAAKVYAFALEFPSYLAWVLSNVAPYSILRYLEQQAAQQEEERRSAALEYTRQLAEMQNQAPLPLSSSHDTDAEVIPDKYSDESPLLGLVKKRL